MMLIDSSRIVKLLEREKEQFLRQYSEYLDQISQGSPSVKQRLSKKDRVLLVVLARFLSQHEREIRAPIGDTIQAAEALIPTAKNLLKTEKKSVLTTQEQD